MRQCLTASCRRRGRADECRADGEALPQPGLTGATDPTRRRRRGHTLPGTLIGVACPRLTTDPAISPPERSPLPDPTRAGNGRHAGSVLARLGAWAAGHLRVVLISGCSCSRLFGAFAPKVESALSGAGWQDSGSQSVAARDGDREELRRSRRDRPAGGHPRRHRADRNDPAAQRIDRPGRGAARRPTLGLARWWRRSRAVSLSGDGRPRSSRAARRRRERDGACRRRPHRPDRAGSRPRRCR